MVPSTIGEAVSFLLLAFLGIIALMVLLFPVWNYGEKNNTWWWNFFMRSDGPFLGSWSGRVSWFQHRHAVTFGTQNPVTMVRSGKVELPAPLTSVTTYWEQDIVPDAIPPGWWRLWNMERKNLALVVEELLYEDGHTSDQVWWRIFPGELWPAFTTHSKEACYQLIEYDDFARIGLQPANDYWGAMGLEGWSVSVIEAKEQVESLINYIWDELPVIRPVAINGEKWTGE